MTDNIARERSFHRIHFDCLVKFEVGDSRLDCELVDISLRGALIHNCTGATADIDTPCKLTLSLDKSHEIQIIMQGYIIHKNENRIGIHCQSIDLDSITHLRKLVEVNLASPELLEREIMALCDQ